MIGLPGRCLACGLSAAAILLAAATPAAGQVPSPALREVPGRWVVRSAGDPRLTLEWDDGLADTWWQASLWGDTLRASGRVAAAPPEPPTVPTGTSTPPSSTGRVSFEALRVDCPLGAGGAPLPVAPPPPHPGVLRRADCYALTPSFDAGQPLEPLLQEVIAALAIVELHPEFEIDADGDPDGVRVRRR